MLQLGVNSQMDADRRPLDHSAHVFARPIREFRLFRENIRCVTKTKSQLFRQIVRQRSPTNANVIPIYVHIRHVVAIWAVHFAGNVGNDPGSAPSPCSNLVRRGANDQTKPNQTENRRWAYVECITISYLTHMYSCELTPRGQPDTKCRPTEEPLLAPGQLIK